MLARSYGFDSWPTLKAYVDGATVARLTEAVRAGDVAQARAMLKARPELAQMGIDNHQVLHYAVLDRAPDMVRVLMQHGANAREGVYPHRDATSALTIAAERGYDEIVAIINEEEQRRREAKSGLAGAPAPDELFEAIRRGDDERAIVVMEANPALVQTCHPLFGWTPLHVAAGTLNEWLAEWLLDRGAAVDRRDRNGWTPLDAAASRPARRNPSDQERVRAVAGLLRRRGAALTARAAVALGEADWLRARHAEGALENRPMDGTPSRARPLAGPAGGDASSW